MILVQILETRFVFHGFFVSSFISSKMQWCMNYDPYNSYWFIVTKLRCVWWFLVIQDSWWLMICDSHDSSSFVAIHNFWWSFMIICGTWYLLVWYLMIYGIYDSYDSWFIWFMIHMIHDSYDSSFCRYSVVHWVARHVFLLHLHGPFLVMCYSSNHCLEQDNLLCTSFIDAFAR